MLEWFTPVVLFCASIVGEPSVCNGTTAIDRHELDPVSTPVSCLMNGSVDAASHIVQFEQEHPNKKLEFRVLCKHSSEKT